MFSITHVPQSENLKTHLLKEQNVTTPTITWTFYVSELEDNGDGELDVSDALNEELKQFYIAAEAYLKDGVYKVGIFALSRYADIPHVYLSEGETVAIFGVEVFAKVS